MLGLKMCGPSFAVAHFVKPNPRAEAAMSEDKPTSFQRTYRTNGDGGGIFSLTVPQPMSPEELADFKDWLAIIVKQSERLTAQHYSPESPTP